MKKLKFKAKHKMVRDLSALLNRMRKLKSKSAVRKLEHKKQKPKQPKPMVAEMVVEEFTGVTNLGIAYDNAVRGRQFGVFNSDLVEDPKKLRLALRKAGAVLTGKKTEQVEFIKSMLSQIPPTHRVLTSKPGFRQNGFVLGHKMIGAGVRDYRWLANAGPRAILGLTQGSLEDWQKHVAVPILNSTYASFGVCLGLGAGLPGYIEMYRPTRPDLPVLVAETAGFGFSGGSGSGKSTVARILAGLCGKPELFDWDFTPTSLEERLASRNDLVLPLDDTETYTKDTPDLGNQLRVVNQKIAGGQSKGRSQVVSGQPYANLSWRTFVVSSSPKPIDDIAKEFGRERTKGEIVRYTDIAVPKPVKGGIFDMLPAPPEKREAASSKLIAELEGHVLSYYGTPMPAFLTYLLQEDRTADVVRYWRHFLDKLHLNGWEKRFAKKFAIAYAAGRLAIDAGILPWPKEWVFEAVMRCYRQAQAGLARHEQVLEDKVQSFRMAAKDPTRFPAAPKSKDKPIKCTGAILGVTTRYKRRRVCALRKDRLKAVAGSVAGGEALIELLNRRGVLLHSDEEGLNPTMQLPVQLEIGGEVVAKPRFYVFDAAKLDADAGSA